MKIIVAVDGLWGIGKNNDLLFSLKEDMKHFKENTLNKVVVMGANTLKSLPDSKPLKNRVNIVLSSTMKKSGEYLLAKNLDELFELLKDFESGDVFVIGGASVYKTLLPYCDEAIVTRIDADGGAEVFFKDLDKDDDWHCESISEPLFDSGYKIRFCKYLRRK